MKRKTLEQFICNAKNVHSDRYDYSQVEYVNNKTKIKIICGEHGLFEQTPNSHLRGNGCPDCKKDMLSAKYRKTLEQFIQDFVNIHGNRYDYSKAKYLNAHSKVNIICENHGLFEQTPASHLRGNGCPDCKKDILSAKYRKTLEKFIQQSITIHGNKYDYSQIEYVNDDTKVNIICKKHGIFKQIPHAHLQGSGCPICSNRISKPEKQWLESIGLPDDSKHRQVLLLMINELKKSVDGYNPETNTVYEFYGDYWHGNPNNKKLKETKINEICKKTFKQLYDETLAREKLIKNSGYNLIVMWEGDWNIHLSELKSARRNI